MVEQWDGLGAQNRRKAERATAGVFWAFPGGTAGALAVLEPLFGATVLSGTGGPLSLSLLEKKKPEAAGGGVAPALGLGAAFQALDAPARLWGCSKPFSTAATP